MNADPQLHERFRRADELDAFRVEAALAAVVGGVDARRRRRTVEAMVLAGAIVALLGLAGWRASVADRSANVPAISPSASVVPVDELIKITPPPPGTKTHQTVADIERYVLGLIAADEEALGGSLVPPRIISVTFVPPNDESGIEVYPFASWVVKYQGTKLVCSSFCSAHPGSTTQFSDIGPDMRSGVNHNDPMICVTARPKPPKLLDKSLDAYPRCEDLIVRSSPTP